MTFTRTTVVSDAVGGDSVKQGCLDLDADLTLCFSHLNTLASSLADKTPLSKKSQPNGICELDTSGLIPTKSIPVLPAALLPASIGCPTGTIQCWATATPPEGWVECDGRWLSIADYPALFSATLGMYGYGDYGFRVPDLRGYFLRGWDRGAGTDPDAATRGTRGDGGTGDYVGTPQSCAIKSHTHTYLTQGTLCPEGTQQTYLYPGTTEYQIVYESGGHESRPRNICLMFCIKT